MNKEKLYEAVGLLGLLLGAYQFQLNLPLAPIISLLSGFIYVMSAYFRDK